MADHESFDEQTVTPSNQRMSTAIEPIRKRLAITLITAMTFCLFKAVLDVYVLLTVGVTGNAVSSFIITVVLFIFYGFGLFSAFRYYRIAILVFAWLNASLITILLICWIFIIPFKLATNRFPDEINSPIFFVVLLGASVVAVILSVFIIRLALKINRILKTSPHSPRDGGSH